MPPLARRARTAIARTARANANPLAHAFRASASVQSVLDGATRIRGRWRTRLAMPATVRPPCTFSLQSVPTILLESITYELLFQLLREVSAEVHDIAIRPRRGKSSEDRGRHGRRDWTRQAASPPWISCLREPDRTRNGSIGQGMAVSSGCCRSPGACRSRRGSDAQGIDSYPLSALGVA